MSASVVALFGEAEKGSLDTVYFCRSLDDLYQYLGEPPKDARGLHFAVQTLLYGTNILYFRVREEGISLDDYLFGFRLLRDIHTPVITLQALFLPGVGSSELIEEGISLCRRHSSLLIIREADFYDYMTDRKKEKTLQSEGL